LTSRPSGVCGSPPHVGAVGLGRSARQRHHGLHDRRSEPLTAQVLVGQGLAWEDEQGRVWLTYNAPAYLAERHGVSGSTEALEAMRKALEQFTDAATRP